MIRGLRRGRVVLAVWAVLPVLTGLLVLRPVPADAQDPAVGFFALTVTAASTNTSGDIGAGGGLTPVDTGAPVVSGRLDSSPTASMIAAAVEPGTLYRTGAALANNEIGDEVVPVEVAEAAYPGGPEEDVSDPTSTGVEGPFASGNVQARAQAGERAISGAARVAEQAAGASAPISAPASPVAALLDGLGRLAVRFPTAVTMPAAGEEPPLLRQQGAQAEAAATGDAAAGTLVASASSTAETVTVAGVVAITDVTGRAVVRREDGELTADAATTYGGVTIAGVPVAVTTDGVVVAEDTPLLPGQEVATLEDQLNAVLEAAGIEIAPISPLEQAGGGSAQADSGGIRIGITSPSSAAVPANVVTLVVGQAVATLSAEAAVPATPFTPPSSGTTVPGAGPVAQPPASGDMLSPPATSAPVSVAPPSTTDAGRPGSARGRGSCGRASRRGPHHDARGAPCPTAHGPGPVRRLAAAQPVHLHVGSLRAASRRSAPVIARLRPRPAADAPARLTCDRCTAVFDPSLTHGDCPVCGATGDARHARAGGDDEDRPIALAVAAMAVNLLVFAAVVWAVLG